jgi:hypothetical protein
VSRRVIEELKAKAGQLFMASWPDTYFSFAAPSVVERHLIVEHPFFVVGWGLRSDGVALALWKRGDGRGEIFDKFLTETRLDPIVDVIPGASSLQFGIFSHFASANRHAYGGQLPTKYEREFERVIRSLDEFDPPRRQAAVAALARFASQEGLPPQLCDETQLLNRCAPAVKAPKKRIRGRVRNYVFFDRVFVDLDGGPKTDVDAAAAAYERLLGTKQGRGNWPPFVAWAHLVGRAIPMVMWRSYARRFDAQRTLGASNEDRPS